MTELQLNIRENICDTLQVFASSERQVVYQKDVPFVHIPREIVAQWDSYCELRDSGWYTEIWNDHELKHLDSFDL